MTTILTPWDPVDHLDSEAAIVAYLDAALEDGDPRLIAAALSDIARARGMNGISADLGFGGGIYASVDQKSANIDFATILKAIHALGLSLHAGPVAAE